MSIQSTLFESFAVGVLVMLWAPSSPAGDMIFSDGFEWANTVEWSRTVDPCDDILAIDDTDPISGAAAMELCQLSVAGSPGLVSADYVTPNGIPLANFPDGLLGVGLLDGFGPNVSPSGSRLLALSSGTARAVGDPGYQDPVGFQKGIASVFPPGFPYEHPLCPGVTTNQPNDPAGLSLVLKAPPNAESLSFRWKFHAFDYPFNLCGSYTDIAAAIMDPPPPGTDPTHRNILVDSQGHSPMGAHSQSITVCSGDPDCVDGPGQLAGTGFEDHGATPWIRTAVPVTPGSTFSLYFVIWDSGDMVWDASLLVDDFQWSTDPASE